MRKDAQAVLLLLIGATLLKISFTGTYVRYVKPGQLPLLIIAGVVLIVIAAVTLANAIRAPKASDAPAENTSRDDEEIGFGHLAVEASDAELPPTLSSLREPDLPPTLSSLRDPDLPPTLSSLRDPSLPPRLSSLREPSSPGSPGGTPDLSGQGSPSSSGTRSSSVGEFGPDLSQEITYREYTPGEVVAVPASHHRRARHHLPEPYAGRASARSEERTRDDSEAGDGHAHVHGEPRIAWLLLVPALALLMFAPPALGSFQASRNGTALSAQADSDFPPLPAGDPLRISMLDYAGRAVFDQGRSLAGRRLVLSGFVIAGPHGESYLARMIVTCCAADGRPVKVGLAGDLPATLKPDQWIEVEGTFVDRADKDPVNAELVPYIQVTAIHNIAAPEQQYES